MSQRAPRRQSSRTRQTPMREYSRNRTSNPVEWAILRNLGLRVARVAVGPVGQQFMALLVIGLGVLTILTVAGMNSGAWANAWARTLVYLFGWGAYPTALFISALGLLWLRHLVHQPTAWRWRPFLGLELTLIGLLTMTHTLIGNQGWALVEAGRGGGLVGWALYFFFSDTFGPLITLVFMLGVTLLGVGLAFDVTGDDVRTVARHLAHGVGRLAAQIQALREHREAPAPSNATPPAVYLGTPETPAPAALILPQQKRRDSAAHPDAGTPPETLAQRRAELPPLTLLSHTAAIGMDAADIEEKKRIIRVTLQQFGLPAEVVEVHPGPTVTQFGVSPGYISRGPEGEEQRKVRVAQIASLADDLALALAAKSLRIEAPVPGRAVVGIEVPNRETSRVALRSVLESPAFLKCQKPLCFAVGLDVAGNPVVADLAAMPHLLVAGTTGSGKSVFVKALAAGLVMNNLPTELRLITIDPKIVELSHLNGLPHLFGPAEVELEHILRVLRWVAHEMDQRYKLLASAGARNLEDYNRRKARLSEPTMPRIVVIIDELADLMMAAPDETERTLTRLAQMARATGIHMVVATQRPSTDVVTGLIKANFPARISFATTSSVDSRVILDTPGAEALMGRGDMLFQPPDAAAPLRVQGCYLSDDELEAIVTYWQKQALPTEPASAPSVAPWRTLAESNGPESLRIEGQKEDADLLERAITIAKQEGSISTSALQRRLRISYPRAARLMEEMEQMGLVGEQSSAGRKRRVLRDNDDE